MANPTGPNDLGANAWLVDEQYELFKNDRNQVAKSWWPILERYEAQLKNEQAKGAVATPPAPSPAAGGSSEPKPEQQKMQEKRHERDAQGRGSPRSEDDEDAGSPDARSCRRTAQAEGR